MRKRIIALLAILCLAAAAVFALADEKTEPESAGNYRVVVEDTASLLKNAEEKKSVTAEMDTVAEYCNVGFYTTEEVDSTSVLAKAEKWGKDTFGKDSDCVVFIIDMHNQELGIWSSDRVLKTMSVPRGRLIVSNVYKMASNEKYADCAEEAFREIHTVLSGGKNVETMHYIGNALMAVAGAILLAYLLISTRMEQEIKVSMPAVVTATAGIGAAVVAQKLVKVVHHESRSGGGGFGGGGGGGGGGGHGGGASHGF